MADSHNVEYDPIAAVEAVEHYQQTDRVLQKLVLIRTCQCGKPPVMPGCYCSQECADADE